MRQAILLLIVVVLFSSSTSAQPNAPFTGTLDDDKSFYEYPLLIVDNNTTIVADVTATSGNLDTILYLLDDAGNILAQNDNRRRDILDAYIEYPATPAGAYTLILARYNVQDGDTSGDFSLTITLSPTITAIPNYDLSPQALTDAGYPTFAPKSPSEWTILVYYGADTDLEEALITDLKEFELAGGGGDNVSIIAFIDRAPDYSTVSGDWSGAKIYEVSANNEGDETSKTISSQEIATLGDIDSGDGLTLAQFLMWGIRHYPATHYAVAFGSHGAGWAGVITDNTAQSIITLPELDHAFSAVNRDSAPINFELVINDACLMSSAEYHAIMGRYFKTSFASPEVVVDPALDMTLFTTTLRANTARDNLVSIGQQVIDRYIDVDVLRREGSDNRYMTNAITDLTTSATLESAIDTFAQVVLTDPLRFSTVIGDARSDAYTYTAFNNGASLIDLGSFMRQVIVLADDDRLIASAQAVIRALEAGMIYNRGGDRVAGRVLYQNIYFPAKAKNFDNAYFTDSPLNSWGDMLRAYYNALTPKTWTEAELFHAPTPPQVFITTQYPPTPSIAEPVRMGMEIIGRNIARGTFTVDQLLPNGNYERVIESPILEQALDEFGNVTLANNWGSGVELSTFGWDVFVSQLTDGVNNRLILTRDADETSSIEGRYRLNANENWHDVIVIFGYTPPDFIEQRVTRVVSRDPNSDALGVVEIPNGAEFQVYITLVTNDGQTTIAPDEVTTFIWDTDQLQIEVVPAPSGDYNLGFLIESFGGAETLTTLPTTIQNEGLAPTTRGYTNLTWGYTVVLDDNWSELIETEFGYSEAYFADETQQLRVYTYDVLTVDPLVEDVLAQYALELIDTQTVTINGESVDLITYQDDVRVGVGTLLATLDGDAIFVGIEAGLEDADSNQLASTAQDILSDIRLFNPTELLSNDTALWDNQIIGSTTGIAIGASYANTKTWSVNLFEDGIWVGASPASAQDPRTSPTFYRLAQVEAYDATVLRDTILADAVQADATNFVLTETRTYYAQFNTWQVARYTAERAGQAITGRVYATVGGFSRGFVIWQEAPSDIAPTLFREVFEPLVDSFIPNMPFRMYPIPEYGLNIRYPRDWGYMTQVDDTTLLTTSADKVIGYYIEFYPDVNDLGDILASWQDVNQLELTSDPQEAVYNQKSGLVVSFEGEDEFSYYTGYAFITTSADETKGVVLYMVWTDTEANSDQFESILNYTDYGLPPELPIDASQFSYMPSLFEATDEKIGLNITYPDSWGEITMLNNIGEGGYALLQSPTRAVELKIYVQPSTDLQSLLTAEYDYSNITLERLDDVSIDGVTGLQFAITFDDGDSVRTGVVLAFIGRNGFSYIFEFLGTPRGDLSAVLAPFIASISTFPPSLPSDDIQNAQIQLADYDITDLSIGLSIPEEWAEPVIEDGILYALTSDNQLGLYVYILDEILPLPEAADLVLSFYEMEAISEYVQVEINGREALEFELVYGDYYGIALVVDVGGRTLMFSIEGTVDDDLAGYYQILVDGLRFMDE